MSAEVTLAMSDETGHAHAPFEDFINFSLDMQGVDGISFETVALALRETIRNLPPEQNGDFWASHLDRLQETLRSSLSIEIVGQLVRGNPRVAEIDTDDLDVIINLTMTLAFICYNELAERFEYETPAVAQSREETTRLWTLLRAASGWVNKAAGEGDTVAQGMARDLGRALEEIRPHGWTNNTRKL